MSYQQTTFMTGRRVRPGKLFALMLMLWMVGFLIILFNGEFSNLATFTRTVDLAGQNATGNPWLSFERKILLKQPVQQFNVSRDVRTVYNTGNVTSRTNSTHECTFPDIDPFDPAIMAVTEIKPPLSCDGGVPHLVYVTGDKIKVNHSKTALVGDQNNRFQACWYRSIAKKPGTDYETIVLFNSTWFNESITLRDNDDNLVVECYGSSNTVLSRSYLSLIRVKKDLEVKLEERLKKHITINSPKEIFNVLMIGIDGNSKQNVQRHMPTTRNYLLNVLNAVELHKYNKVADHTYPNVIPILTGETEKGLQHKHANWTWMKFFDYVNDDFVWSDFSRAGYRTGLYLDSGSITAFHFEKKGWAKTPVDYYYRATLLELERDQLMRPNGPNCVGDIPEVTYNFNFWLQMASAFKDSKTQPFFGYSFFNHLTHLDANGASAGDHLYLRFFQQLKEMNAINNTIIIFFSDHGPRVGKIRQTYPGMIESMTPHVFLVFPPWFHRKYPDLMKVLKINQERLTTNRDLHATLLDILNFQGKPGIGDIRQPGISLFNEIPRDRTCRDAEIPIEFCLCNKLTKGNVSAKIEFALASVLTRHISWLTDKVRKKCRELFLDSVLNVMEMLSDNPVENQEYYMYQITIRTKHNGAVYEAKYAVHKTTSKVQILGNIKRLNFYRGQADCINDTKLMPFCYCK